MPLYMPCRWIDAVTLCHAAVLSILYYAVAIFTLILMMPADAFTFRQACRRRYAIFAAISPLLHVICRRDAFAFDAAMYFALFLCRLLATLPPCRQDYAA